MKDLQFQTELREKLEDPDVDDQEIVRFVLEQAGTNGRIVSSSG